MKLFNWLKSLTKYPQQQVTSKQKELIDLIDVTMTNLSDPTLMYNALSIKTFKVGLFSQHLTVSHMFSIYLEQTKNDRFAYIPRSVALIVDAEGTWTFYIGVRCKETLEDYSNELFMDALSRTNQARVE